ncbi:hypothetical protein AVEN_260468-1 [Araneus ventricosus]|uniref:Uncharacterized protein n=1 Tax=Araneus ventricosus TaxID=182803 RepID=A0A4Y2TRG3_ARAVE|nr:hypothetical protein AVEN_260468-1 [Araneus ventricosus]
MANLGKEVNLPRTINNRLSEAIGGAGGFSRHSGISLGLNIWLCRFEEGSCSATNYTRICPNVNCEFLCVRRNTDRIPFASNQAIQLTSAAQVAYFKFLTKTLS